MANLNELLCTVMGGNTGVATCQINIKEVVGAIIVPKGYEFDVTDPQTTLLAACLNTNRALRAYPLWDFEAVTDASEKKVVQTLGYGPKQIVRRGFNDWSFQFIAGGLLLLQELQKFNGQAWDFYFVDSQMFIMGISGSTATKLRAIPSVGGFVDFDSWMIDDGSKVMTMLAQFVYNQKYANGLMKVVKADFDLPTTLYGLQNVFIVSTVSATPGTYTVSAKTAVGENLGDTYAALADPTMWVAKNFLTGAAITITGVTYSATTGLFSIVLTVTAPPYPGAGEFLTIGLTTPTALNTAGVRGFETYAVAKIVKN